MSVNLSRFDKAIKERGLMASWGDGLFTTTDAERAERANRLRKEAEESFIGMMKSSKSKSDGYETWAICKALGVNLRTKPTIRRR